MVDQLDDDRLVEIEAALEQLRQVKEDTFKLIANLQKAVPRSRGTRRGKSWMVPQATEGAMNNADE